MKQRIVFTLLIGLLASCDTKTKNTDSSMPGIEGTWELISGTTIVKNDTTFTDYTRGQKMIKVINSSHFAFLKHDLNKGKDSAAIFGSGGGRYTLSGHQYTEHLDYCSDREWEGNSFPFKVSVKNDTLLQSGTEKVEAAGIDRVIIEKYFRVK